MGKLRSFFLLGHFYFLLPFFQVAVWGTENPHHKGRASYMLREVLKAQKRTPIRFYSMRNEGETKVAELFENELGIDRWGQGKKVASGYRVAGGWKIACD